MKLLAGKNALLTGGSRGIGPIIAHNLAREGVNLALVARSADRLEMVARSLSGLGVRVVPVPANLADAAQVEALFQRVEAELGPVDLLINNAAVEQVSHFAHLSPAEIQALVTTNLTAPLLLTRLALPGMLARGSGHIVNIASIAGKKAPPYNAVYGATKAALIEWSGALRGELAGSGVGVSVVCPGFIGETGMFVDNYQGKRAPWFMGESPPEAIAQAVLRAIRQNRQELLVTPRPARLGLALYALWPELGNMFLRWVGVTELFREVAENPHSGE
ncbi:MAG: short-chain dehydrogenase [Anaerolineae bacterium]|nr:SDR family NAD(P)-dependent oxidoreductase [Anaerolineales bacterium]MCQ3980160.1 short-chain dehydrogenase [Anaerolineae bacterium]